MKRVTVGSCVEVLATESASSDHVESVQVVGGIEVKLKGAEDEDEDADERMKR